MALLMRSDCTHIMLFPFCSVVAFVVWLWMWSTFIPTAEATTTKSTSPRQCSPVKTDDVCMYMCRWYMCTCEGNPNNIEWLLNNTILNRDSNSQGTARVLMNISMNSQGTASVLDICINETTSIVCRTLNSKMEITSNVSEVLQGSYTMYVNNTCM